MALRYRSVRCGQAFRYDFFWFEANRQRRETGLGCQDGIGIAERSAFAGWQVRRTFSG
jgi:hypothetical protein